MENILEVNGLYKKYDGFTLKDVTFSLPRGYIMGFVGENGAGKTTTIRLILNMAKIDGGKVWYTGTKDELAEKYVVIKGDAADIPDMIKEKCIGYHDYRSGFEVLLDREHINDLSDEIEYEKASFDEILVYVSKEEKYGRH